MLRVALFLAFMCTTVHSFMRKHVSMRPKVTMSFREAADVLEQFRKEKVLSSLNPEPEAGITTSDGNFSLSSAVALVAGTTVGAGIIALPQYTIKAGFEYGPNPRPHPHPHPNPHPNPNRYSTLGLTAIWVLMVATGLLVAEVCTNFSVRGGMILPNPLGVSADDDTDATSTAASHKSTQNQDNLGIVGLTEFTLGKIPSNIVGVLYLFLHYAIIVAYMSAGGNQIASLAHIPPQIAVFLYALAGGSLVAFGREKDQELVNNVFVSVLVSSFVGLIVLGVPHVNMDVLLGSQYQHPRAVLDAFPVFLLALVYHNIVPYLVRKLHFNREKITSAIVGGTLIPLIMFSLWNFVVLGSPDAVAPSTFDPTLAALGSLGPGSTTLVSVFSLFAISTSLLGFIYGILDFLKDAGFVLPQSGGASSEESSSTITTSTSISSSSSSSGSTWIAPTITSMATQDGEASRLPEIPPDSNGIRPARSLASLIAAGGAKLSMGTAIAPPLIVAELNPNAFLDALDAAGLYGISVLYGALPAIMAWKLRRMSNAQPSSDADIAYQTFVGGGTPALVALVVSVCFIVYEKIAQ